MAPSKRELELAKAAMIRQLAETEQAFQKYQMFPQSDADLPDLITFTAYMTKRSAARVIQAHVGPQFRTAVIAGHSYPAVHRIQMLPPGNYQVGFDPAGDDDASYTITETETEVEYRFAALRVEVDGEKKWFLTGSKQREAMDFDALIEFMVEHKVKAIQFFARETHEIVTTEDMKPEPVEELKKRVLGKETDGEAKPQPNHEY